VKRKGTKRVGNEKRGKVPERREKEKWGKFMATVATDHLLRYMRAGGE